MKLIRSIFAILIGMIVITAITELIEYFIVSIIMGIESNPANPEPYFAARNQTSVLVVKHFYNFLAGFVAGFLTSKIAGYKVQLHAYIVMALQVFAIAFALNQPEIRQWLPISLWISITIITILGVYTGMLIYLRAKRLSE